MGGRPADAGYDWDHGFDTVDDRLADDHLADADHDWDHGFDTVVDRLADDHLVGEVHDFDMDVHPADLDRVVVLPVTRYRHHRAHTSYGIRPDCCQARAVGVGHGFDKAHVRLVEDHPAGAYLGSGREDAHLVACHFADADHDFGTADDHLVGDHRRDVGRVGLQHDFQNYHRVGQRYLGAFHRRGGEHYRAAYEYPDVRHLHPSGH